MDDDMTKGKKRSSSRSKKGSRKDKEVHHHYHMDDGGPGRYGPGAPPPEDDRGWKRSHTEEDDGEVHIHYYYEPPRARRRRSAKPTVAAVLMLLTGVLALLGGAALTGLGSVPGDLADFIDVFTDDSEGDISGTITSTNGDPMENVTVSVVGESISAETNNVGYYILQNIPVGDHEIKVEKAGYNTIVYKIFVDPSDHHGGGMGSWDDFDTESKANNEHDFTLTEGSGTIEQGSYPPWDMVQNIMVVCGAVLIVAGIVVIVGAYSAYKRKNFPMAIIGAVVAMITGIGLIFGLIAIFILALSRDEFRTDPEEPWRR